MYPPFRQLEESFRLLRSPLGTQFVIRDRIITTTIAKTAKPIWEEFIKNNQNLKVGNYSILYKSVDCDADPDGKQLADKYNVKGYPTFKLERGPGDVVEFEAKPTHDNFTNLLHTSLT